MPPALDPVKRLEARIAKTGPFAIACASSGNQRSSRGRGRGCRGRRPERHLEQVPRARWRHTFTDVPRTAGIDEMSIGHVDFIYMSDEEYAQELRAQQSRQTQQP